MLIKILDSSSEIWKDVKGYEGLYKVSNKGNVMSVKRCLHLNLKKEKHGYIFVYMSKNSIQKNYLAHRVVAYAFIDNPKNLPQVNHKDGNKSNNSVENLEWCDNDYNMAHAIRTGLIKVKGAENGNAKTITIRKDSLTKHFGTHREACNFIGVGDSALSNAIKRKNKCKGFDVSVTV